MSEAKYCPFCQRDIEPEQEDGVVIGWLPAIGFMSTTM
uniref:Uncharacterized protein n=1 Tax=Aeromonas salmonicida subsp. salmonicida TaxID=29491 RepID=A0A1B2LQK2_AERSS|nr:hypothetical protein [Aeromonas salmonicida subsp. salmonicida]